MVYIQTILVTGIATEDMGNLETRVVGGPSAIGETLHLYNIIDFPNITV
jgi:hypothetical protein